MSESASPVYTLADLLTLMARLRDHDTGCDWDVRQTYRSIAPSTIEEAYEVVDAIEKGDYEHLREELGDLLFQVVFHSQLADEEGQFTFADVVDQLTGKLIRRHPHVFPEGTLQSRRAPGDAVSGVSLRRNWEETKEHERLARGAAGVLDDIPLGLPATTRAAKLQKRASRVGFDWSDVDGVLAQLDEELRELCEAIAQKNSTGVAEEAGDLLFAMVNLTRHLGLDAESVLRAGNRKFERRFRYIENRLQQEGSRPQDADLERMEALWQAAKREGL